MKIIWTFTLLMIPGVVSSISVTGYSGGEVNITCKYNKEYTANAKYFCRGKKPDKVKNYLWCSELIKTYEKDKWVHSGRFSLYDDTRAIVFTVTMRNLSERDSGTYQCGVDRTTKKDSYAEVKLNVITERNEHQTTSAESPLITSSSPVTGSSLIISVSVLLLLIITVILLVIVTLWRRRQSHTVKLLLLYTLTHFYLL
ncbi:CMRF35-like molecule 8 [Labeo rohita]|uniref:CMRF35-like molecule 8 n=1 Tax=Labeo rohita TaxID=84645 RepID=UPI0021E1BF26|nr:CMRF35-like molecule 8 [Labeo rohita]